MTTYYAAVKWPVEATKADIAWNLPNDLELMILGLIEEKGFKFEEVRQFFEDALDSVEMDLPSDDNEESE